MSLLMPPAGGDVRDTEGVKEVKMVVQLKLKKEKNPKWNKDESSTEPGSEYQTLSWNIHGHKENRAECKTPNSTCNPQ